jgi:Leucine-rich repeat (LRR) protein
LDIFRGDLAAGPVPESIGLCTKLKSINFYLCKLTGKFPEGLRGLKALGNPRFAKRIARLELKFMEFTGAIPSWLCELVLLTDLRLEHTNLEGSIPACIGSLILLEYLNLSDSQDLSGELPIGICDLVSLEYLEIEDTSVEGMLPDLTLRLHP